MIHCKYDKLLPLDELSPNPKNRNKHPEKQIERLASIIEYQGWRHAITISNQTGLMTKGHGRLLAARQLGLSEVPVVYQDYADEDQEIADLNADNAIAAWSEIDFKALNEDLADFSPDFDLDMLGIEGFELEPADKESYDYETCPTCQKRKKKSR